MQGDGAIRAAVSALMLGWTLGWLPAAAGAQDLASGILADDLLIKKPVPTVADTVPGSQPRAEAARDPASAGVEWKYTFFGVYGPTFTSADGKASVTVGMFVWLDNTFVTGDELAEPLGLNQINGDSRVRTAKLEVHALYGKHLWTYFRVDFQDQGSGSGDASMEWAVLGLSDVPVVQNLMIGLQQPLYGLDLWGGYPRHRLFLEPSLMNAFYRGPLLGITAFDVIVDPNISWALGVARDTTEERLAGLQAVDLDRGSGDGLIMGRLGWDPIYGEQGTELLHLGVSGAWFKPDNDIIGFGFYPEIFTTNAALFPFVRVANVDESMLGGVELRYAHGPFWLQTEYLHNKTTREPGPDLRFGSYYVEGGWFLTGEQSVFTRAGLNGQVVPASHFNPATGDYGSWEIKFRYSHLDLTDEEFQGGNVPGSVLNANGAEVTNYTVGLRWILNLHVETGINYIHSVREDLDDASFDAIQARVAFSL